MRRLKKGKPEVPYSEVPGPRRAPIQPSTARVVLSCLGCQCRCDLRCQKGVSLGTGMQIVEVQMSCAGAQCTTAAVGQIARPCWGGHVGESFSRRIGDRQILEAKGINKIDLEGA